MAVFHSYSSPLDVVQSFLESVPLLYTVMLSAEEKSALTVYLLTFSVDVEGVMVRAHAFFFPLLCVVRSHFSFTFFFVNQP